jgi:serine O-acetyltransferase
VTVYSLFRRSVERTRPSIWPDWWRQIYLDYRRYRATEESALTTIFLTQGFWASCVYRVSRATIDLVPPGPLQKLIRAFTLVAQKFIEITTGILLPRLCDIGEGLFIGHFGGIIFPAEGRIGSNCNIGQNVTIGTAGKGAAKGAPVIGNRVFIAAHSVVVGKISIGDDAMICAGSVVTRSVPARAVVMGNPAKVISYEGSFDYVVYDGMEEDAERRASLACALENTRRQDAIPPS